MMLQALAHGSTVHELAQEVGYSERELFRILADLYRRMGVSNRSEAIVQVAMWGFLEQTETERVT